MFCRSKAMQCVTTIKIHRRLDSFVRAFNCTVWCCSLTPNPNWFHHCFAQSPGHQKHWYGHSCPCSDGHCRTPGVVGHCHLINSCTTCMGHCPSTGSPLQFCSDYGPTEAPSQVLLWGVLTPWTLKLAKEMNGLWLVLVQLQKQVCFMNMHVCMCKHIYSHLVRASPIHICESVCIYTDVYRPKHSMPVDESHLRGR